MISYKRNKQLCYQMQRVVSIRDQPEEKKVGPFDTCGNCSYASHGFICYQNNGSCLRNYLKKKGDK